MPITIELVPELRRSPVVVVTRIREAAGSEGARPVPERHPLRWIVPVDEIEPARLAELGGTLLGREWASMRPDSLDLMALPPFTAVSLADRIWLCNRGSAVEDSLVGLLDAEPPDVLAARILLSQDFVPLLPAPAIARALVVVTGEVPPSSELVHTAALVLDELEPALRVELADALRAGWPESSRVRLLFDAVCATWLDGDPGQGHQILSSIEGEAADPWDAAIRAAVTRACAAVERDGGTATRLFLEAQEAAAQAGEVPGLRVP
jgi:hypothetical protein